MDKFKVTSIFLIFIFILSAVNIGYSNPSELHSNYDDVLEDRFQLMGSGTNASIASYKFEGNTKDSFGNHNLSSFGGLSYTSGVSNQAADLDGTDDHLVAPSSLVNNINTDSGSVTFWIERSGDIHGYDEFPLFFGGDGRLITNIRNSLDELRIKVGSDRMDTGVSIQPGELYQIAITWNGNSGNGTANVYLNGSYVADWQYTGFNSLDWGSFGNSSGRYYYGMLDEMNFFNYTLSQSKVYNQFQDDLSRTLAEYNFENNFADRTSDHDLTPYNGPSFGNGVLGNATQLDGTNDFLQAPNTLLNNISTDQGSVILWINRSGDIHGYDEFPLFFGGDGRLIVNIRNSLDELRIKVGSDRYDTGISINPNYWQQIAVTWNGNSGNGTANVYLNGSYVADWQYTGFNSLDWGWFGNSSGRYYYGMLDEMTFYDQELSASSIQENFDRILPLSTPEYDIIDPSLTSYYGLNGTLDDSINSNHLSGNNVSYTDSLLGKGVNFDGNDDNLQAPDSLLNDINMEQGSVILWINRNGDIHGYDEFPLFFGGDGRLIVNIRNSLDELRIKVGSERIDTGKFVNPGEWHQIAVTWNGTTAAESGSGTASVYHNGSHVADWQYTGFNSFDWGSFGNSSGRYYYGQFDELAFFNGTLNSSSIVQNFNVIKDRATEDDDEEEVTPPSSTNTSLLSYYSLNSTLTDLNSDSDLTGKGEINYDNGILGSAVDMDGSDDHLIAPESLLNNINTDEGTVILWVNRNGDIHGYDEFPLFFGGDGRLIVNIRNSLNELRIKIGSDRIDTGKSINPGNWYQIAVTWKGTSGDGTAAVYLNGSHIANWQYTGFNSLDWGSFGNSSDDRFYYGMLDEVAFYDGALDQNQILDRYSQPSIIYNDLTGDDSSEDDSSEDTSSTFDTGTLDTADLNISYFGFFPLILTFVTIVVLVRSRKSKPE